MELVLLILGIGNHVYWRCKIPKDYLESPQLLDELYNVFDFKKYQKTKKIFLLI